MIVKIDFGNGKVMLFGDSYKPWSMQFEEYYWNYYKKDNTLPRNIEVSVCRDKWIGWGGLKWCNEDIFQKQLDREGCQDGEPDNPNPRLYADMVFREDKKVTKKVAEIMRLEEHANVK